VVPSGSFAIRSPDRSRILFKHAPEVVADTVYSRSTALHIPAPVRRSGRAEPVHGQIPAGQTESGRLHGECIRSSVSPGCLRSSRLRCFNGMRWVEGPEREKTSCGQSFYAPSFISPPLGRSIPGRALRNTDHRYSSGSPASGRPLSSRRRYHTGRVRPSSG
jgi:hypothetical protein